jgi:hypothetical protein
MAAAVALLYLIACVLTDRYTGHKAMIIMELVILRLIDAFEDVFIGRLQQKGRLDIGARTGTVRQTIITAVIFLAEAFSGNLHKGRLGHPYHPQFLKISVCPHIMVPLKEIHLHSPVHQRDKGTKHTYISLRDDMLVFIPEIPYVTKKIKGIRILRQRIQKIRKTPLPVSRILDIKTQMHVRYKICQPALHYAKMNMQRAAIRQ